MDEWLNERVNEWMNKFQLTKGWDGITWFPVIYFIIYYLYEWMNDWMNELMNEWMNEWISSNSIHIVIWQYDFNMSTGLPRRKLNYQMDKYNA